MGKCYVTQSISLLEAPSPIAGQHGVPKRKPS